jgi:hypothetical protein
MGYFDAVILGAAPASTDRADELDDFRALLDGAAAPELMVPW